MTGKFFLLSHLQLLFLYYLLLLKIYSQILPVSREGVEVGRAKGHYNALPFIFFPTPFSKIQVGTLCPGRNQDTVQMRKRTIAMILYGFLIISWLLSFCIASLHIYIKYFQSWFPILTSHDFVNLNIPSISWLHAWAINNLKSDYLIGLVQLSAELWVGTQSSSVM